MTILFTTIALSLVFFLLYNVLKSNIRLVGYYSGFLLGLSYLVWIQSQLFVWNFGQFNGRNIDWTKWKHIMYFEGVVWFLVIVLFTFFYFRLKRKFQTVVNQGIYLLGLISIITSFVVSSRNAESGISESATCSNPFSFNKKKNVVIILLDAFQSDYFDKVLRDFPEDLKAYNGFTFYRNTISKFPTTKGSLPSILTGEVYYNDKVYATYVSEARKRFDIVQAYNNMSYNTCYAGLKGTYPGVIPMKQILDRDNSDKTSTVVSYFDYALFRGLPTFLKQEIFNRGNWLFSSIFRMGYPPEEHGTDIRFLELFEKKANATTAGAGTFNIMHFYIAHPPWNVDEHLKFNPNLNGETGYIRQIRGAISFASRIISKLKKIGVYDSSEIVIMSDHGTWEFLVADQRNGSKEKNEIIPQRILSSSHALLLYKPIKAEGHIKISDIPLELTDLSCLLELKNPNNSCDSFKIAVAGGSRIRSFYFYEWSKKNRPRDEHLPKITKYIVNGHAYKESSYHLVYQVGRTILFSREGNSEADPFLLNGWSWQEPTHRWTDGALAGLRVQLESMPTHNLILRLWGQGYYDPIRKEYQKVSVRVNGKLVAEWVLRQEGYYDAPIELATVSGGLLNIEFMMSNPRAPNSSGNSKDQRKLGLLVKKLCIMNK
ncbi:MAG: sulfatase-like hydrolase/transferase [Bacteroidales bacterium]